MSFAEKIKRRRGDGVGICMWWGRKTKEKLKPPYNLLSISHSLSLSITFVLPNRHFFARLEEVQLGM